jgi:hypothetical protein
MQGYQFTSHIISRWSEGRWEHWCQLQIYSRSRWGGIDGDDCSESILCPALNMLLFFNRSSTIEQGKVRWYQHQLLWLARIVLLPLPSLQAPHFVRKSGSRIRPWMEEAIVRLSLLVNGVCDWEEMHLASLSRDLKRVVDDSRAHPKWLQWWCSRPWSSAPGLLVRLEFAVTSVELLSVKETSRISFWFHYEWQCFMWRLGLSTCHISKCVSK